VRGAEKGNVPRATGRIATADRLKTDDRTSVRGSAENILSLCDGVDGCMYSIGSLNHQSTIRGFNRYVKGSEVEWD
jgi:hypothetical protein